MIWSRNPPFPPVIPAEAGIEGHGPVLVAARLDPGFRRDDGGYVRRDDGVHVRPDDGGEAIG